MANEQIEKLATLAKTRREIASVQAKIPEYVSYSGHVPKSLDELDGLPEPWKRQVISENPALLQDLADKAEIARRIAAHDKAAEVRREALKGLPFTTMDEFNALDADDRESWTEKMTPEQKRILTGGAPRPQGAWL